VAAQKISGEGFFHVLRLILIRGSKSIFSSSSPHHARAMSGKQFEEIKKAKIGFSQASHLTHEYGLWSEINTHV
jgi:hypothetical protein